MRAAGPGVRAMWRWQARPQAGGWLMATPTGASTTLTPETLSSDASHAWLGCMYTSRGSRASCVGAERAASMLFLSNKACLCDHTVCLKWRLLLFAAVVTPVACFAAAHKAMFHADIRQFDAELTRSFTMMSFGGPFCSNARRSQRRAKSRPHARAVARNMLVGDLNLDPVKQDGRRIEVIANGLPLWGACS